MKNNENFNSFDIYILYFHIIFVLIFSYFKSLILVKIFINYYFIIPIDLVISYELEA